MSYTLISMALGAALSAAAPTPQQELSQEAPPCFDLAVVARVMRQTPTPFPDAPEGVIVMSWPWNLSVAIEQRLAGREARKRINVAAIMHTEFNHEIEHFLMFLKRRPDGYALVRMQYEIVEDASGRFVMPLAQPLSPDTLSENDLFPADYLRLLRPVRYRARDAWWLQKPHLDQNDNGDVDINAYPWSKMKNGRVIADRGLRLSDFVNALSDRRCHGGRES